MSNQMANILAGAYYDQLTQGYYDFSVGNFNPACLEGSMHNPLLALRLMCMDVTTGCCLEPEQLAEITGVPASWFEVERLSATVEEVVRAMGVVSLVLLSCMRNEATKYGFKVPCRENPLEAVETFKAVQKINKQLQLKH